MNWKNNILVLMVGILFACAAFFGMDISNAQTANPKTAPTPPPLSTPEDDEPIVDDEPIKIDTEVVNVLFTAQDKKRRLLTTLKQGDVKLIEDGKEQEIIYFGRKVDLPLSLAILIDTSASQERTLPEEKEAAKSFIDAVVRPQKDEVAIVSFTGESTLEQSLTNNISRLRRAVDRVEFIAPSGYLGGGVVTNGGRVPGTPPISGRNQATAASTAIWDAVWITADEILRPSPDKTRRAIVLLTDGEDTFSQKKIDEAVQAALKAEAVVYSIGIGDNFYNRVDTGALKKISERTGGRAFFPRDEGELREAFAQIQDEMRSQYLIAYEPINQARDGSYRTIDIQLANSDMTKQGIKLTHRQGYFSKTTK